MEPWGFTDRHVCADSFFSSVQTAEKLYGMGFRYTDVVKTAHKNYPLKKLSEREMAGKGDGFCLSSRIKNHDGVLVALCWVDRERRYFISTAGSIGPGTPFEREGWRQTQNGP